MVGAHQNFNGLRDLTTLHPGVICHPWARTCYYQRYLPTKFEVSISSHCEDMKGDTNVENRVVWSSCGSLKVNGNSTIR